jgi:hypothetical protein
MTPRTILRASGGAAAALVLAGLVADIRSFDTTSGGYEPPYEDFTGDPIDWSQAETTETGMRKPGHVVAFALDCTSGMIRFGDAGPAVRLPARLAARPRRPQAARGLRGAGLHPRLLSPPSLRPNDRDCGPQ